MSTLLEATERALAYWQQWHQTKDSGLGFKKKSSVFAVQSSDFDSMCDKIENHIAQCTDVAVNGLLPIHREALRKTYGISNFWLHGPKHLATATADAKALLGPILERKGVIIP